MGEQAKKALAHLVQGKREGKDNEELLRRYEQLEEAKAEDHAEEKRSLAREAARNMAGNA